MTKKHFIALANEIRLHNEKSGTHGWSAWSKPAFTNDHLDTLADFLKSQNPQFNRERWLDYIAGRCGQNGGAIK